MLEEVSLFRNRRDFFHLLLLAFTLFSLAISLEFYNYKELTKFDSQLINATVLKQYTKSKPTKTGKTRTYQVLKLKSDRGFVFYTTASKKLKNIKYKKIQLEAWAGAISFYQYMSSFYCFSKILKIFPDESLKTALNAAINVQHENRDVSLVYQALYTAKQLPFELQRTFSKLGISHLIAISGFHLGLIAGVLFFLIKYPYRFFQARYFPYRSAKIDTFIIISISLFAYLLFLEAPPSLLRAFVMLIIGFILYDRHIKIISMQTLLLSTLLILALFPRLFFSIGLWLSVAGVFYIFLFLIYFKNRSKLWQFLVLPLWVYMMMLPYSLAIFTNFSLYHPLSILWTSLFTLFYPLSIFLHIIGFGDLLDFTLIWLMQLNTQEITLPLTKGLFYTYIGVSLLSIYKRSALYVLMSLSLAIFIYAIKNVA